MNLSVETFLQVIKSLRSDALTPGEGRKMPRVGVRGRCSITVPAKTGKKQHQASVRDLSATGIGLLVVELMLAVGDEFVLLLPSGGQEEARAMLYSVARIQKLSPNLYSLGAIFKKEVPFEHLADPRKPAAKSVAPKPIPMQQITQQLLDSADKSEVLALEQRLKMLST